MTEEKKETHTPPQTPKKEKPSNCAGCKKPIRKRRWYYRNGKYYCSKRCWKTAKEEKAEAPKEPQEAKKQ